ncbi:MAG TPA: glycosyltransferase family protein [Desulfosarcina sp.]|nr:glycosyltransferase family protein [Desulfosarcina sp.]
MRGQFEHEINAVFLAALGYGCHLRHVTRDAIADFLSRLPDYKARLDDYRADGNRAILAMVDRLLAEDGRLAKAFHLRRSG